MEWINASRMKATYGLRKSTTNKYYLVELAIYHKGTRIVRKSTGIKVREDQWDDGYIVRHRNKEELNQRLQWFKEKTLNEVKDEYEKLNRKDFFNWAREHIEKYTQGRTSEMYSNKVRYFQSWLIAKHGKASLDFEELNRDLVRQYRVFLEEKGHTQNTVSAYLRPLRTIALRAEAEGVIERSMSWKFLIPTIMTTINDALNVVIPMEGFHEIYMHEPHDYRRKVFRALAITQYLLRGMDFVDVILLRREYWEGDSLLFPGRTKLEKHKRQSARFYVPRTVQEIFKEISNHPGEYLFPVVGLMSTRPKGDDFRKYYSKWLKQFGLNGCKHIRHNFATHLYQLGATGDMVTYALLHSSQTSVSNKSMRIAYIKMQDDVLKDYLHQLESTILNGNNQ